MNAITLNEAMRIRVECRHGASPESQAERYQVPLEIIERILDRSTHSVTAITNQLQARRMANTRPRRGDRGWH